MLVMGSHQQIAAKLQLVLKSCKTCREVDDDMAALRLSGPGHPWKVQELSAQQLLLLRAVHAEHLQGALIHCGSSVSVTLLMLMDFLIV